MMRIGPNAAGTTGTGTLNEPNHSATSRYQHRGDEDIGRHPGQSRRDALGADVHADLREHGRNTDGHQHEASRNAFEQSLKRAFGEAAAGAKAPSTEEGKAQPGAEDWDAAHTGASQTDGTPTGDARTGAAHAGNKAETPAESWAQHALKPIGKQSDQDEDPASLADAGTLKLLALAERAPGFALAPSAPPTEVAPAGTEQAIRVAALTQRIEEAVRAELYAAPGRPIALKLELGDLVPGLLSVSVAMTPEGIDVTLARSAGEASPELLLAAQALAERLQTRFAKRIVRVLDAPVAAASNAGSTGNASSHPPEIAG